MRSRDLLSAAAGAVIATALAGGVAWAAIPSSGGVINGCYQKNEGHQKNEGQYENNEGQYQKNEGQLRVIDPAIQSCRRSELPIAWNEQGPKGETGDKGDKGDPGAAGKDGRDGTSVTVVPEAAGANCLYGGAKISAATGVAYVCSALPPDPGPD